MSVDTLGRSRTAALCVPRSSKICLAYAFISAAIQASVHAFARNAEKHSLKEAIFQLTEELTLERNHSSVPNAEKSIKSRAL